MNQVVLSAPDVRELDRTIYRTFANGLIKVVSEIEKSTENVTNPDVLISKLDVLHFSCALEENVAGARVLECFLSGQFLEHYSRPKILVADLVEFLRLLKRSDGGLRRVIVSNLFARLDDVRRFDADEIPF